MSRPGGWDQVTGELRASARALIDAFRSPLLARVQLAYIAFNLMEWAAYIAIQVYAFRRSGIGMVGVLSLIQLVPAAIVGPFASVLGDRYPRDRVLLGAYIALTMTTGATAVAMLADLSPPVVYVVGSVAAWTVSLLRPVHSAVLPGIARTPEELSVGYATSSLIESSSILLGPLLAGALMLIAGRQGISGPGLVDAVLAGLLAVAAVLVAGVVRRGGRAPADAPVPRVRLGAELTEGFRVVGRDPRTRLVLGLIGLGWFTLGVVDVAMIHLAFEVLGSGDAGVGFLNAAVGAGGVIGSLVAVVVATRPRTFPAFRAGVILEGLPLVGIAAAPGLASAMLAVSGAGQQISDTTGTIMLQRLVPDRKLSRVFGVLESVFTAPEGIGGFVGALAIAGVGLTWTLGVVGVLLPVCGFLLRRRIAALDVGHRDTQEEMALLRRNPIFAPLPPVALDRLARDAVPAVVPAGTVVIREGDPGDRFYAIVRGEVEATRAGSTLGRLTEGEGFGEIALLRDVPRTATVTTTTATRVLTIEREDFLLALSGHPDAGRAAHRVSDDRLLHHDEPDGD